MLSNRLAFINVWLQSLYNDCLVKREEDNIQNFWIIAPSLLPLVILSEYSGAEMAYPIEQYGFLNSILDSWVPPAPTCTSVAFIADTILLTFRSVIPMETWHRVRYLVLWVIECELEKSPYRPQA